ncbi:MAG: DUF2975 domain-containing protein [Hyphomicrobium sp.]
MASSVAADFSARTSLLRRRVGWLCHLIRFTALVWIAWGLVRVVLHWNDFAAVSAAYGRMLKLDLSGLPVSHYTAAYALVLLDWAGAALVVVFVWRLFGHYLAGNIFSLDAVTVMRRLGFASVASVGLDILVRPAIAALFTMHLESAHHVLKGWADPNDLLHLLMGLFVLALAHIFKTGVEIADDHRQII